MTAPGTRDVTEWRGLNLELFFATEILRLRSLHYGYWESPPTAKVGLGELRKAQDRFTDKLLSYIPEGTTAVLDVGAGIGDVSRALAERGHRVAALSPDRNHARYFAPLRERGVEFHNLRFEDFDSPRLFDLVLISEALNYFEREAGLRQCRRFVRRDGHLLVAAMFRFRDHRPFVGAFRAADLHYVEAAAAHGFTLVDELDITAAVAPTMRIAQRGVRLLSPFLRAGATAARGVRCESAASRLDEVREYYSIRTDPAYFQRSVRYVILLLCRDSSP